MKEVAGAAENQLLYRLFFTSSPYIAIFYKSLIINNNSTRTCVQRVSETFAVKVVQNAGGWQSKKSKFSHPKKQPKVRKMGTMVQHPFKFRKNHKLRNYGFFDVRGLFTEDWRPLFISVGAPNVKSPLKRSAVLAQISAGSCLRKSLLHGRLTKFLYAAIFTDAAECFAAFFIKRVFIGIGVCQKQSLFGNVLHKPACPVDCIQRNDRSSHIGTHRIDDSKFAHFFKCPGPERHRNNLELTLFEPLYRFEVGAIGLIILCFEETKEKAENKAYWKSLVLLKRITLSRRIYRKNKLKLNYNAPQRLVQRNEPQHTRWQISLRIKLRPDKLGNVCCFYYKKIFKKTDIAFDFIFWNWYIISKIHISDNHDGKWYIAEDSR